MQMRKAGKRGRPSTGVAQSAAERMRRYRARKKATGLRPKVRWVSIGESNTGFSFHRVIDARSLALHCRIVGKIDADRSLLDIAKRNLGAWSARHEDAPPRYIAEWQRILELPWRQVAATMTEQSENAIRLRQSSPFAGVLTPAERKQIYDAFRT